MHMEHSIRRKGLREVHTYRIGAGPSHFQELPKKSHTHTLSLSRTKVSDHKRNHESLQMSGDEWARGATLDRTPPAFQSFPRSGRCFGIRVPTSLCYFFISLFFIEIMEQRFAAQVNVEQNRKDYKGLYRTIPRNRFRPVFQTSP